MGDLGDLLHTPDRNAGIRAQSVAARKAGESKASWFAGFQVLVRHPEFMQLGVIETRVMLVLLRFAGNDGLCWPSNKTLRQFLPRVATSRIRAAISSLERSGFLVIRDPGGGAKRPRIVEIPAISSCMATGKKGGLPTSPKAHQNGDAARPPCDSENGDVPATKGGRPSNKKGDAPRPPNSQGTARELPEARERAGAGTRPPAREGERPESINGADIELRRMQAMHAERIRRIK